MFTGYINNFAYVHKVKYTVKNMYKIIVTVYYCTRIFTLW